MTYNPRGGYQAVADMLTSKFSYPVPRQQVYAWWARRAHNKFPEGEKRKTRVGTVREFSLLDVEDWFRSNYPESRRERLLCQRESRRMARSTDSNGSTT